MEEVKENNTKEAKKKPNKILFTIFMFFVFIIIAEGIIWGFAGNTILDAILNYPQGRLVISEAVLSALVLIVMLLFKNSYVFTQKREKFTKGFYYGAFYLLGIILFTLMYGIAMGGLFRGLPVINLLVGCFLVGVAEEFLCRGWLLNEFLERFGNDKKGIWYSIIVSGLIFGLMHLGNIYNMGQSVPTTIIQACTASATGILFGLIYYKTKNIWSVVVIHGLWDFSLFLGNIVPLTESREAITSFSVIGLIFALLMVASELINIIPYIKDIDAEPKKGQVIGLAFLSMFLFFVFTLVQGFTTTEFGKTFKYDNISISEYSILSDTYETYSMDHTIVKATDYGVPIESNNVVTNETTVEEVIEPQNVDLPTIEEKVSFTLSKKNDETLVLKNNNTGYSVELLDTNITDYIIADTEDAFVLAFINTIDSNNIILRYEFLKKDEMSNDDSYLDGIKAKMKSYLLASESSPELLVLGDKANNKSYVTAYDVDYGYLVLVEDDKMSVLNRD